MLILDIKLPGLSGFDILKSIREQNIKIKVIVVSGRPENIAFLEKNIIHKNREMEEENILKSADAVIGKPINVRIMLDKAGELLRKK